MELLNDEEEEYVANQIMFRQYRIRSRMLRDTSDPFSVPTHHFIKYYRMSQETTLKLIQMVEHGLVNVRSSSIPVHLQVLLTLRFLAEGQLQKGLGQDLNHPAGQSTVSKCIDRVLNTILTLHDRFIQFPMTQQARINIRQRFRRTIRIPNILGIVDGFLVTLKRPPHHEEAFYNYRVGCSMNVQIVTDSDYNILNVRVCPGSNNDRFVWGFSEAKEFTEYLRDDPNVVQEEGLYYILADSGYTPSPVLLTPVLDAPEGSPASIYTTEHVGTRRYVEQTIGILTGVWRALNRSRKLFYEPEKSARIIKAACILHNFRIRHGIPHPPIQLTPRPVLDRRVNRDHAAGMSEREWLIEQFYTFH